MFKMCGMSEWLGETIGEHVQCGYVLYSKSIIIYKFTYEMKMDQDVMSVRMKMRFLGEQDGICIVDIYHGGWWWLVNNACIDEQLAQPHSLFSAV